MAREAANVASDPEDQAEANHSGLQEQAQHIARLRAERHANADFTGALHHAVSHHAVNSDRGDDERDQRERS